MNQREDSEDAPTLYRMTPASNDPEVLAYHQWMWAEENRRRAERQRLQDEANRSNKEKVAALLGKTLEEYEREESEEIRRQLEARDLTSKPTPSSIGEHPKPRASSPSAS
jgi:hypothetical protein